MKTSHVLMPLLAAIVLITGAAYGQTEPARKSDGILVTTTGMTLYTFDKDIAGSGKSACNGPCASIWPPAPAPGATLAAPYSVITRDDGGKQLAYNGKPLYLYASDKKPSDRAGDNFKDVWHVVKD